jgi:nicotinate-nucleotide adenylyltransferase
VLTPARLAASLGGHLPPKGARVGLLGGSFNPAHRGHLHISREAQKRLGLDQVWWLVSPQNPLKAADGMAPLAERLAAAQSLVDGRRLVATDIETVLGTRYTADTLRALRRRFPKVNFVWLMGADNLIQVSQWEDWQRIFHCLPVAALARPTYSLRASRSKAAERFKAARWAERRVRGLAEATPPAWTFLHIRLSPLSATRIRAAGTAGRTRVSMQQR